MYTIPRTPTPEQAEMAKYDYRKNGHKELDLALCQLKIWAQDHGAKSVFGKAFTLFDLKILVKVNFLLEQNQKSFIEITSHIAIRMDNLEF
ncbi:12216_t:CDS:2 [Gigaspora margarita]|uniref:12216_t:CDS:1 n=1 Tax=Gigaspora margarita TaxID=4874 RepID=A0ABN7ULU8_GIGMA|nr:12216_t:CDS:2 [Gigaspora margarita]